MMHTKRNPKVGDTVVVPKDGNQPQSMGIITNVGSEPHTTVHGTPYVWVSVRRCGQTHSSVWASYCLGYHIDCN